MLSPSIVYVDDTEPIQDNDDNEGSKGNQCDSDNDADDLLNDYTKEVKMVVNSSDDDIMLAVHGLEII